MQKYEEDSLMFLVCAAEHVLQDCLAQIWFISHFVVLCQTCLTSNQWHQPIMTLYFCIRQNRMVIDCFNSITLVTWKVACNSYLKNKLPSAFCRSDIGFKYELTAIFMFGLTLLNEEFTSTSCWHHSPLIKPQWLLVKGRWGRHSSDVYNLRRGTVPCKWMRRSGRTAAWVAGAEPIRPASVLEDRAVRKDLKFTICDGD